MRPACPSAPAALGSSKPEQGNGARKGGQPKAGAKLLCSVERARAAVGLPAQKQPLLGRGWGGQPEPRRAARAG